MRKLDSRLAVAAISMLTLALSACSDSNAGSGSSPKELVIGMQTDFSGEEAVYGQPGVNAAKLAVKHINDAGGVFGRPVKLAVGDAASQPQQAASEAQRMVNVEGASVIVTLGTSGECLAIKEGLAANKVPVLGTACVSPAHTANQSNKQGYFFRVRNSVGSLVGPAIKMMGHDGVKKVCGLYVDNAYGQGAAEHARKTVPTFDPGAELRLVSTPLTSVPSRLAEIRKCTADGYDTMLAMFYGVGQGDQILKESAQNGLAKRYYFMEDLESSQIFAGLGWTAFDGMVGFSGAAAPGPAVDAYQAAYKQAYGGASDVPLVEYNYDAVLLAALAAEKAQSTDGTKIRDAIFEIANGPGVDISVGTDDLKKALDAIKQGKGVNYVGLAGVQFADNGEEEVSSAKVWHVDATKKTLPADGYVIYDAGKNTFQFKPTNNCRYCDPAVFQ